MSWDMVRLGDVCTVINGSTPKTDIAAYWDGDIVWVTPTDLGRLSDKVINDSERHITSEGYNSANTNILPEKSIILSTRAPIGHIAIVGAELCTNQGCKGIVPSDDVNTDFLYYYLWFHKADLAALGSGATFKELSTTALCSFEILFPPLDEQRRIAAEVERQLAIVEKAKQAATEQLAAARALNAAYLREVFEGNVWEQARLGDICNLTSGKSVSEQHLGNTGIPYIQVEDLNSNFKYAITARRFFTGQNGNIPVGTVIFPKRGGAISTNKKRITQSQICIDLNIMGITPKECLNVEFFYYYFLTVDLGKLYDGSSVPQINNKDIEPLKIPLPSLNEQHRIVERLEKKFTKTKMALASIQSQLDTINAMPAAILRQAFSGQM